MSWDDWSEAFVFQAREEDMTEKEPTTVWGDEIERECSLCGDTFVGLGNNPEPLAEFDERCCNDCNTTKVIPARLGQLYGR
jgi:hypothetical protein